MTVRTPETEKFLEGKSFSVVTQGCRSNHYEAEALAASLENAGAIRDDGHPDITVLVTCIITGVAEAKCRKLIRRARRKSPNTVVVACGCYVQNMDGRDMDRLGIDIAVGNRLKYRIPELLRVRKEGEKVLIRNSDIVCDRSWDRLKLDRPRLHTRAFVKVQDGCDNYCSYCIVPYVRGAPVSRDIDEVIDEVCSIAESGCPEVVLTGIHIGLCERLPELIDELDKVGGLKRLRFGSVEPLAVTDELLASLAESRIFCPHLHIPLQSGDDAVLERMKRGYSAAQYAEAVERARKYLGDGLHVSTDLMVAFPSETRGAFANSLNFARDIAFGKVHVFPYSVREGTEAAEMEQVPREEADSRVKEALELADSLHRSYCSRWLGKDVEVLVEENVSGRAVGLSPHYVRVEGAAERAEAGSAVIMTPRSYRNEILIAD